MTPGNQYHKLDKHESRLVRIMFIVAITGIIASLLLPYIL